jgi:ABC-type phosphate/phosphonate transport system ATPase subunit
MSPQIENGALSALLAGPARRRRCADHQQLVEPTGGRIVAAACCHRPHGQGLRRWRARAAMVFQQFNLIGRLGVLTSVLMGRGRSLRRGAPC